VGFTGNVSPSFSSVVDGWRSGFRAQLADLKRVPKPELGDVVGGVSVALVLIPQSLAYAGLAGLPPFLGLYAAAFPLVIFAIFASSPYLQTGPVALTSLLTAGALTSTGAIEESADYIEMAALLALIVGVARLLIGVLRLGSVVYLMAEPVTMGFTSGAGIVILTSQLPKALGVVLPADVEAWGNPLRRAGWSALHPAEWEWSSIVISVITLVLMLGGRKVHRLFPGVLVAVVVALLFSIGTDYDGPIVGEIDAGFPTFSLDLPFDQLGTLLVGGLVIALVGFAEPASIARTFASEEQMHWSSSREFFASGMANMAAGITGAFPVGGSFSRSSVNRFAGARTRWSGGITGIIILAFLPFSGLLEKLPLAVLGAIVVGAVLSLIKPMRLVAIGRRSPWQAALAWVTFFATLLTPPQVQYAVMLGVGLTLILHVARRFHLEVESNDVGELQLKPRGLLWIGTTTKLRDELRSTIEANPGSGPVVVNLERTTAIDSFIADSLASGGAEAAAAAGRDFWVSNAPDGAAGLLAHKKIAVVD